VSKADGVFLWVVLVVKSLVSGLRNGDGIVYLRRRLEKIPSDIEKLYAHMLSSIDLLDMEDASQMIQIFWRSGHDLDLATLERALRTTDYLAVINMEAPIAQDSDTELAKYRASLKRMNLRLNNRCKGLLEALEDDPTLVLETDLEAEDALKQKPQNSTMSSGQNKRKRDRDEEGHRPTPPVFRPNEDFDNDPNWYEQTALDMSDATHFTATNEANGLESPDYGSSESMEEPDSEVGLLKIFYLHRTVRDYLELPQVWEGLLDKTRSTDFDPCATLLMAYVTDLKTAGLLSTAFSRGVDIGIKLGNLREPSERCISLRMEINRLIKLHWWS
jgi:hypothetical protein